MNIFAWLKGLFAPVPDEGVPAAGVVHKVKASSFADPADVRAFRNCKSAGKTDMQCFRVGDNAIGLWGDRTDVDVPMCALPYEAWQPFYHQARGKKVRVTANGRTVICELADTMPHEDKITNGAGIDLNPAAGNALGLRAPFLVNATWQWV